MFRKSFDRSMHENVEERPTVYVHLYAESSLCTQLAFMHAGLGYIHTWTYSCVCVYVLEFMRMQFTSCVHVPSPYIRRHEPMCACH